MPLTEIEDALRLIADCSKFPVQREFEPVALADALGRCVAHSIVAPFDHPPFNQSLRDGIAVRSTDGKSRRSLIPGVTAGVFPNQAVLAGQAAKVMTGAPVPEGADCVAMVEHLQWLNKNGERILTDRPWQAAMSATDVLLERELVAGQFVLPQGSLFQKGQTLVEAGTVLNPASIGLLASIGKTDVEVLRNFRISILITGDEVRQGGDSLHPGQIFNSNGPLLESLAGRLQLEVVRNSWIGDDAEKLSNWLDHSLHDSDLIITTGGVSAGEKDLLPELFVAAGVETIFHGVRIKPGKPVLFGRHVSGGRNCFVFGLPGNPVSCQVCFAVFVQTLVKAWSDSKGTEEPETAILSTDWKMEGDRTTFWPARLGTRKTPADDGSQRQRAASIRHVTPLSWQGSADLMGPALADVLIQFEPTERPDGIWSAGESVRVFRY